jgi:two-component system, NtrC family, sensor kinase
MLYASFRPYILSSVILLCAVPLALRAEIGLAMCALLLGLGSFLHTRSLLRTTAQPAPAPSNVSPQECKAQVFASVDELSAGIAHEINNPLAIISQETEWLQHLFDNQLIEELNQKEDCKDCLREISRQVDRCKEIVKKLLSLARQMNPVIQEVNINSVLRNLVSLAQREASQKKIEIIEELAPELPVVFSDPPLLRQVFLNLLVNATQALDQAGSIMVRSRVYGTDGVEVSVQDNGSGISPEHLDKIFTPFFSTKPEGKGTGLGLAMSRGIVERLGGTITVISDTRVGTTFTVRLPVRYRGEEGDTHHAA